MKHGIIFVSYYMRIIDLQERGINMLFVLGGNGTHAGANAIHNEVINPLALHQSMLTFGFCDLFRVSCAEIC